MRISMEKVAVKYQGAMPSRSDLLSSSVSPGGDVSSAARRSGSNYTHALYQSSRFVLTQAGMRGIGFVSQQNVLICQERQSSVSLNLNSRGSRRSIIFSHYFPPKVPFESGIQARPDGFGSIFTRAGPIRRHLPDPPPASLQFWQTTLYSIIESTWIPEVDQPSATVEKGDRRPPMAVSRPPGLLRPTPARHVHTINLPRTSAASRTIAVCTKTEPITAMNEIPKE